MATTKKATQKATETNVPVIKGRYGNKEALLVAASLKGNIGRPMRSRGFLCLTAEKKSDVTKGLRKMVGPDQKIEYSNPLLSRKRKGVVAPIDGETRIWVGVTKMPKVSKEETEAKPEKATKAKAAKKKTEVPEPDQIATLTAQVQELMKQLEALKEA